MYTVSATDATLLYQEFEALDLVGAGEARFLSAAVREAVRTAQRDGQSDPTFQRYRVRAWRVALGSRPLTVTWRVVRGDAPMIGDTYILPVP
jgi:hypothetical protein